MTTSIQLGLLRLLKQVGSLTKFLRSFQKEIAKDMVLTDLH